jgi:hypothetical protein
MTVRKEAVAFIARRLARGATWTEAVDAGLLPAPTGLLGHVTRYVNDLYDNGSLSQWGRFRRDCERLSATM